MSVLQEAWRQAGLRFLLRKLPETFPPDACEAATGIPSPCRLYSEVLCIQWQLSLPARIFSGQHNSFLHRTALCWLPPCIEGNCRKSAPGSLWRASRLVMKFLAFLKRCAPFVLPPFSHCKVHFLLPGVSPFPLFYLPRHIIHTLL